ncbi:MAG: Wzz/FepE/Etk N-terminal domain-containing protein [Bacteroidota bacterium]
MSKKRNNYNFDFIEVIGFIYKWRKHLIIVTIAAALLSMIFSSSIFITPKYQSSATFYPGTTNSISTALFYSNKERGRDPLAFGDEETDEYFIQLLESGDLKGRIINKYNLMDHYHIKPDTKDKYTILYRKYDQNVSCKRTNYNSIEINVLDENPQMAADIANAVLTYVDTVKNEIQGRVAKQAFQIVERELVRKQIFIDSIKAALKEIGSKGMYNVQEQAQALTELQGKGTANQYTDKEKKTIGEYGGDYINLENQLIFETANMSDIRKKYEQSKVDVEAKLSNIFVVNYASPAEGKAYPIRSLIVLLSTLITFVTACIVLVIIEKYQQFKKSLANN